MSSIMALSSIVLLSSLVLSLVSIFTPCWRTFCRVNYEENDEHNWHRTHLYRYLQDGLLFQLSENRKGEFVPYENQLGNYSILYVMADT